MNREELKQKARESSIKACKENRCISQPSYEAGYIAGVTETGIQWHDLRKDPNDLPEVIKEYITNIGVMTFDGLKLWTTQTCDACDYYEEVTDKVIAWCEIPQFKE